MKTRSKGEEAESEGGWGDDQDNTDWSTTAPMDTSPAAEIPSDVIPQGDTSPTHITHDTLHDTSSSSLQSSSSTLTQDTTLHNTFTDITTQLPPTFKSPTTIRATSSITSPITHVTNSTLTHHIELPQIQFPQYTPSSSLSQYTHQGELLFNINNHNTIQPSPIYSTSSHFTNSTFASTFTAPTNIGNSPVTSLPSWFTSNITSITAPFKYTPPTSPNTLTQSPPPPQITKTVSYSSSFPKDLSSNLGNQIKNIHWGQGRGLKRPRSSPGTDSAPKKLEGDILNVSDSSSTNSSPLSCGLGRANLIKAVGANSLSFSSKNSVRSPPLNKDESDRLTKSFSEINRLNTSSPTSEAQVPLEALRSEPSHNQIHNLSSQSSSYSSPKKTFGTNSERYIVNGNRLQFPASSSSSDISSAPPTARNKGSTSITSSSSSAARGPAVGDRPIVQGQVQGSSSSSSVEPTTGSTKSYASSLVNASSASGHSSSSSSPANSGEIILRVVRSDHSSCNTEDMHIILGHITDKLCEFFSSSSSSLAEDIIFNKPKLNGPYLLISCANKKSASFIAKWLPTWYPSRSVAQAGGPGYVILKPGESITRERFFCFIPKQMKNASAHLVPLLSLSSKKQIHPGNTRVVRKSNAVNGGLNVWLDLAPSAVAYVNSSLPPHKVPGTVMLGAHQMSMAKAKIQEGVRPSVSSISHNPSRTPSHPPPRSSGPSANSQFLHPSRQRANPQVPPTRNFPPRQGTSTIPPVPEVDPIVPPITVEEPMVTNQKEKQVNPFTPIPSTPSSTILSTEVVSSSVNNIPQSGVPPDIQNNYTNIFGANIQNKFQFAMEANAPRTATLMPDGAFVFNSDTLDRGDSQDEDDMIGSYHPSESEASSSILDKST